MALTPAQSDAKEFILASVYDFTTVEALTGFLGCDTRHAELVREHVLNSIVTIRWDDK